jgi:hypothetical protein
MLGGVMSWFRVESGFRDHPKLKRLARSLNVSHNEAKGMVASLWCWCLDHAVDGNLSSFEAWDLADAAGWEDEPSVFLDALIAVKLLDETPDGLEVHEWMDRAGSFREALRKQKQRAKSKASKLSRDCPGTVVSTRDGLSDKEDREDRQTGQRGQTDHYLSTSQTPAKPTARDRKALILKVYDHYRTYHPRSHPKPNGKSKESKRIRDRLEEGYSVADLCKAIDGCHRTPHNTGSNDRNQTYLGLELIMRTSDQVARFVENADRFAPDSPELALSKVPEKDRENIRGIQDWINEQ